MLEGVGLGQRHGAPAVPIAVEQPLHPLLGAVLPVEVLDPGGAAVADEVGAGLFAVGGVEETHGGDLGGLFVRVLLYARVEGISCLVAGLPALGEDVGHDESVGVVVVVDVGVRGYDVRAYIHERLLSDGSGQGKGGWNGLGGLRKRESSASRIRSIEQ